MGKCEQDRVGHKVVGTHVQDIMLMALALMVALGRGSAVAMGGATPVRSPKTLISSWNHRTVGSSAPTIMTSVGVSVVKAGQGNNGDTQWSDEEAAHMLSGNLYTPPSWYYCFLPLGSALGWR